jgi:hypothetical protein
VSGYGLCYGYFNDFKGNFKFNLKKIRAAKAMNIFSFLRAIDAWSVLGCVGFPIPVSG